jgi:hypothetical protein
MYAIMDCPVVAGCVGLPSEEVITLLRASTGTGKCSITSLASSLWALNVYKIVHFVSGAGDKGSLHWRHVHTVCSDKIVYASGKNGLPALYKLSVSVSSPDITTTVIFPPQL